MTSIDEGRGLWDWKLVRAILFFTSLFFVYKILKFGFTEEGIRQCIRWSARFSVSLFCLAFAASSLPFFLTSFFLKGEPLFLGEPVTRAVAPVLGACLLANRKIQTIRSPFSPFFCKDRSFFRTNQF